MAGETNIFRNAQFTGQPVEIIGQAAINNPREQHLLRSTDHVKAGLHGSTNVFHNIAKK